MYLKHHRQQNVITNSEKKMTNYHITVFESTDIATSMAGREIHDPIAPAYRIIAA